MNKTPTTKNKNKPMRKCIITNTIWPKQQLLRIVVTKNGQLLIDTTGKHQGRGAYLQPKLALMLQLKKSKCLERALKVKVSDDFYETINKIIKENWD